MLANAAMDNEGDINFANDKNYLSNTELFFDLLDADSGTLTIQHRPGSHHGFVSISSYLDFFCFAFGRSSEISARIIADFASPHVLTNFSFSAWNSTYSSFINYTVPRHDEPLIPNKVAWVLGSDVLGVGGGYSGGSSYCEEGGANNNYLVQLLGAWHDNHAALSYAVSNLSVSFGGYVNADLFYPETGDKDKDNAWPVLLYVAGYNYNLGVVQTYGLHEEPDTDPLYLHFATRGYVVATFHALGFGERLYDGTLFYDRFGALQQSRMAHMVRDVRLLIDFLQCLGKDVRANPSAYAQCQTGEAFTGPYQNELKKIPNLDVNELTVVGYAVGGAVAIHAAALDARIANVASIAGFTPWRANTDDLPNSGNHYLFEYHALMPKLGLFEGEEASIPYDYTDLFEVVAPRNVLLYAPQMDRNANYGAVEQCIADIKPFWSEKDAASNLTVVTPNEVGNLCDAQYQVIEQWLNATSSRRS